MNTTVSAVMEPLIRRKVFLTETYPHHHHDVEGRVHP